MTVIIGVDPHTASHTAVAIGDTWVASLWDARYGTPGGVVLCGSGWWRNTPPYRAMMGSYL